MKNTKYLVFAASAALLFAGALSAAESAAPSVSPAPPAARPAAEELPDAATLQKLARRAVWDAVGVRMHVGPVILRSKLPDGSWLVDVILENGRPIRGRLYRHRRRYRIALERSDFFVREQTIRIEK